MHKELRWILQIDEGGSTYQNFDIHARGEISIYMCNYI